MKQLLAILFVAMTGCAVDPAATPTSSADDDEVSNAALSTERTDDEVHRRSEFMVECFAEADGEGCNFEQFCQCAQYCHNKSCTHYCDLAAGGHCQ